MAECFLYNNCNHRHCDDSCCVRKERVGALLKMSLLPEKHWVRMSLITDFDGTDLEEFKRLFNIEKNIGDFVSKGYSLFLHSKGSGNGKTSWAIRLVQAYINYIWPESDLTECKALFIHTSRFLQALKDNFSNRNDYAIYIKNHLDEADLVVWDDIGAEMGSDYDINQLLNFIDRRTNLGKTNIFTSNLNKSELEFKVGTRLASRIGAGIDIELNGKDKRKNTSQVEEY